MKDCKPPKCQYSEAKDKCVQPNPYLEALAWCKRNDINHEKCKDNYNSHKDHAKREACKRYEEKLVHVNKPKSKKPCKPGQMRNPKTGRCIKIKVNVKKECPEGKVRNPKTGRCVNAKQLSRTGITSNKPHTTHSSHKPLHIKQLSSRSSSIKSNQSQTLANMRKLSDFSNIKGFSSSRSSQYSRVFKRQPIEKKNAKFLRKKKQEFVHDDLAKDPMKKPIAKDKIDAVDTEFKRPKALKKHVFIKDLYDKKGRNIFEKEEDEGLKNSLRDSLKNKPASAKSATSRSLNRRMKELLQKIKARKVKEFLRQNLLRKHFTLDKRVKYFEYIRKAVQNIDKITCIKPKEFKNKIDNKVTNGYTINDIIDLEKRIGSESAYGVIYSTSIKNILGRSPIATKLMENNQDNYTEIDINIKITNNIIRKKLSRHFLITYKSLQCDTPNMNVPNVIMGKRYYMSLNELAHGDLESLTKKIDYLQNSELVLNCAVQCMLSIATFHRFGYIHMDCHWGNFLYHIAEDTSGFYHYQIYGKDYYLKNCGYTMMIYDFGLSEKYTPKKAYLINYLVADYNRISRAFRNVSYGGWSKKSLPRLDELPVNIVSAYMSSFSAQLTKGILIYKNEKDFIQNIILPLLEKTPHKVFYDKLPHGQTIINAQPYIIDDTLKL